VDYAAVRKAFTNTHHCVLATATPDGAPWLSALFFNYDASYTLVWESTRLSRHSQLLKLNPRVSVYIAGADKIAGALYASGAASEVAPADLARCLDVFLNGPHQREDPKRTVADYAPGSPIGLYAAHLDELYILKQTKVEGYILEERERVDLKALPRT